MEYTMSLQCLPLYEGVDWNYIVLIPPFALCPVSLFTREWIEIFIFIGIWYDLSSPSLRGSGLKYNDVQIGRDGKRLPLYEGVDWNSKRRKKVRNWYRLPLYEGVDWNRAVCQYGLLCRGSPSLRGSGLKLDGNTAGLQSYQSPSLRGSGLK